MQLEDWSGLRVLLALARTGRIAQAARALGVDDTTVSRRLKALERDLGCELVARSADGTLTPTPVGADVVARAEMMEGHAAEIEDLLGRQAGRLRGTVRITAVPLIANRVLVPALPPLLAAHPELTVEILPEARDLDLARREADLALRMARPSLGGLRVTARRLGTLAYGVFCARGAADGPLPWINYDDAMAYLPQARWLARLRASREVAVSGLRVRDAETALEAIAHGIGQALLPVCVGAADGRLRAVDLAGLRAGLRAGPLGDLPDPPTRELWLLTHADSARLRSVQTVRDWVGEVRWPPVACHPGRH